MAENKKIFDYLDCYDCLLYDEIKKGGSNMLTNQIHGIALRLSIDNQNGIDPATVLNLHFEKEKEINDWVYYSTNVSQDSRLTDRISMIVFFFKQGTEKKYIKADVVGEVLCSKTPFIPENKDEVKRHSPKIFSDEERKTWYKIQNLQVMDEVELSNYVYRRNDTFELELLNETLQRSRFSKCYFESKIEVKNKLI